MHFKFSASGETRFNSNRLVLTAALNNAPQTVKNVLLFSAGLIFVASWLGESAVEGIE